MLKLSRDTKGYLIFKLCLPGEKGRTTKVHRAVAAAFLGVAVGDVQVNHKNGDKRDNRLENLEYVSCRENIRHCWNAGLHGVKHVLGESNVNTPLTESDVTTIRELYPRLSYSQLATIYGVSSRTIGNIVKRRTWKHI